MYIKLTLKYSGCVLNSYRYVIGYTWPNVIRYYKYRVGNKYNNMINFTFYIQCAPKLPGNIEIMIIFKWKELKNYE